MRRELSPEHCNGASAASNLPKAARSSSTKSVISRRKPRLPYCVYCRSGSLSAWVATSLFEPDVRVISATNRDLEVAIGAGSFRRDLFYRLSVFPIESPPLRERKADIPMLVEYFIDRYARKVGKRIRNVEKSTMQLLSAYSWPGNIRELQNVIERSVILCDGDTISVDPSWLSLRIHHGAAEKPAIRQEICRSREGDDRGGVSENRRESIRPRGCRRCLGNSCFYPRVKNPITRDQQVSLQTREPVSSSL